MKPFKSILATLLLSVFFICLGNTSQAQTKKMSTKVYKVDKNKEAKPAYKYQTKTVKKQGTKGYTKKSYSTKSDKSAERQSDDSETNTISNNWKSYTKVIYGTIGTSGGDADTLSIDVAPSDEEDDD